MLKTSGYTLRSTRLQGLAAESLQTNARFDFLGVSNDPQVRVSIGTACIYLRLTDLDEVVAAIKHDAGWTP